MRPHWKERLKTYPRWRLREIVKFTDHSQRWRNLPWWNLDSGGRHQPFASGIFSHLSFYIAATFEVFSEDPTPDSEILQKAKDQL